MMKMSEAQNRLILEAIAILYEIQYATPRMIADEMRQKAIKLLQQALFEDKL
jgi:uncharacterized protein YbaR (Trm112 family)